MTQQQALRLFEEKKVRTVWDDTEEKWYFSIVDVVSVLTDSSDPKQYLKKMRTRDTELQNNWGTICTPVRMMATDGKLRLVDASDTQGILRIIQSIPSPKAEPFKQWMARGGRVDCFTSFAMTDSRFASLRGGTTKQSRKQVLNYE